MNKCLECESETTNNLYCCFKCRDVARKKKTYEKRKCEICGNIFECRKKDKKRFCSPKCSAKHKSLNKESIGKKIKQTKMEKYGDENYTNVEKSKKTCLERYGTDSFSKTDEYRKKFNPGSNSPTIPGIGCR